MIPAITNKNTVIYIFLSSLILISTQVAAQDILYLNGGGKLECLVTNTNGPKVTYKMWQNRRGPDYVVPKSRLQLLFFQDGGYAAFDESIEGGMVIDKSDWKSDFILTKEGQLEAVDVENNIDGELRYSVSGRSQSRMTAEVLLILYQNGDHELLGGTEETNKALIKAKTKPASDQVNPPSNKDEVVIATPENSTEVTNESGPDNSGFELNSIDRKEFSAKALDKTRNLGQYFSIIADKETNWQDANEAIDLAVTLFVSEEAQVEVSSTSTREKKTFPIRKYLERLKLLKYERVEISWSDIAYVSNLKKGVDGNYYGVVSFVQKFTGYRDGKPVYSDYTRKNIEVVLKGYTKKVGGQTQELWDVFLSDIGVVNTRRG